MRGGELMLVDLVVPSPLGSSGDVTAWLISFVATLAIELAILALIWSKLGRPVRMGRWMLACVLANMISHPSAMLVWVEADRTLQDLQLIVAFLGIECAVIAFEAFVFRAATAVAWSRAWAVSVILNVPTAMLGAYLSFDG